MTSQVQPLRPSQVDQLKLASDLVFRVLQAYTVHFNGENSMASARRSIHIVRRHNFVRGSKLKKLERLFWILKLVHIQVLHIIRVLINPLKPQSSTLDLLVLLLILILWRCRLPQGHVSSFCNFLLHHSRLRVEKIEDLLLVDLHKRALNRVLSAVLIARLQVQRVDQLENHLDTPHRDPLIFPLRPDPWLKLFIVGRSFHCERFPRAGLAIRKYGSVVPLRVRRLTAMTLSTMSAAPDLMKTSSWEEDSVMTRL